jgi:hypothetical protein|tara:strand:- start:5730 stop:5903 length:174 start_codon:yes stop_codon:yes gene_type:complete
MADRAMDLTMLEIANARERSIDEWKAVFEMADERFQFMGVTQPEGSKLSMLELVWTG